MNIQLDIVNLIIRQPDAYYEATDAAGRTALMLACERKDLEIARLLLGCGAWTKPRDSRHFSALDYATIPIPLTHSPEVPQLLVELLENPKVIFSVNYNYCSRFII